ncbi:hypothetical protein AUK10_03285 [Candidatus Gracilibacteria bacterium CG2_30_37_12]|nr:MAG: hypothetical protein AUK10_03285 [Candidatus Gracilibacteria bacterium CG2_30_37_12]
MMFFERMKCVMLSMILIVSAVLMKVMFIAADAMVLLVEVMLTPTVMEIIFAAIAGMKSMMTIVQTIRT